MWRCWGDAPPEARPLDSAEVDAVIDRALARDESALPAELAGAQREAFSAQERDRDDLMGAYSRSFEYRDERGTLYLVSCDFPYEGGWHELTVCYRGVGWTLEERTIAESDAEQGWPRMEASFTKPGGVQAFLTVCGFDETGTAIPLPTMSLWEDAWRALTQRETRSHRVAFQVQVFTTSGDEIDERTRDTARALLLAARQLLREQIIERGAAEAAADDQATTAGAERDEAATDEGAPRTGADQP
ncbi:MAG TPA: exosortase U [Lacipirellulaceae bacterium]|nr:exosortase U [Lacipirellulaceae bacterium]